MFSKIRSSLGKGIRNDYVLACVFFVLTIGIFASSSGIFPFGDLVFLDKKTGSVALSSLVWAKQVFFGEVSAQYSFAYGLGSPTQTLFALTCNPFTIIALFFSAEHMVSALELIVLAKLLCALMFCVYLGRRIFDVRGLINVVLSLSFVLSLGDMIFATQFFALDLVYLLPASLIAIYLWFDEDRLVPLSILLAYTCVCCLNTLVIVGIFVLVYALFCCVSFRLSPISVLKKMGLLLVIALVSLGLASFVWIPLALMQSRGFSFFYAIDAPITQQLFDIFSNYFFSYTDPAGSLSVFPLSGIMLVLSVGYIIFGKQDEIFLRLTLFAFAILLYLASVLNLEFQVPLLHVVSTPKPLAISLLNFLTLLIGFHFVQTLTTESDQQIVKDLGLPCASLVVIAVMQYLVRPTGSFELFLFQLGALLFETALVALILVARKSRFGAEVWLYSCSSLLGFLLVVELGVMALQIPEKMKSELVSSSLYTQAFEGFEESSYLIKNETSRVLPRTENFDFSLFEQRAFTPASADFVNFGLRGMKNPGLGAPKTLLESLQALGYPVTSAEGGRINYVSPLWFTDSLLGMGSLIGQSNPYGYSLISRTPFPYKHIDVYENPRALNLGFLIPKNAQEPAFTTNNALENQSRLFSELVQAKREVYQPNEVQEVMSATMLTPQIVDSLRSLGNPLRMPQRSFVVQVQHDGPLYLSVYAPEEVACVAAGRYVQSFKADSERNNVVYLGNYGQGDRINLQLRAPSKDRLDKASLVAQTARPEEIARLLERLSEHHLELSYWDSNSYAGNINATASTDLFLTVPYDEGWKFKVDGSPVQASNYLGLTRISLDPGLHHIQAQYALPGLVAGRTLSLVSAFGLVLVLSGSFYRFIVRVHARFVGKGQDLTEA